MKRSQNPAADTHQLALRICGVHMISVSVEDFGPPSKGADSSEASQYINLDSLRHYFNFLSNTEPASLIATTRKEIARVEKEQKAAGQSEAIKGNSVA